MQKVRTALATAAALAAVLTVGLATPADAAPQSVRPIGCC